MKRHLRQFTGRLSRAQRAGFTLVELLVVIGIIAVLSGIMVVSFGGSSESARAAKCLSNMRALAVGANAIAMSSGYYPLASSIQRQSLSGRSMSYYEVKGWISWLSNNGEPFKGHPSNPVSCEQPKFYGSDNEEDNLFAITNGTMWRAVNMNREVYRCPAHVLKFQKQNGGRSPLWSYVMNGYFGYDYSEGSRAAGWGLHRDYGTLTRADKKILFAELPYVDPESGASREPSKDAGSDCVLQFKATVDGESYGDVWKGTPESIGFNHRRGKKGYCAHVAFADGHVETFEYGKGSGLKPEELTALLCNGKDVAFDGQGYQLIKEND